MRSSFQDNFYKQNVMIQILHSESQFKILKYHPDFPDRFGSQEDAMEFYRFFFKWYNTEHCHGGIEMLTPEMIHYGLAEEVIEYRRKVLKASYRAHIERFVRGISSLPL